MAEEIIDNGIKNKLTEVWGCESTLYYPKYAYAGCIGIYEGKPSILILSKAISQNEKNLLMIIFIRSLLQSSP